jgi:hypothetical protein
VVWCDFVLRTLQMTSPSSWVFCCDFTILPGLVPDIVEEEQSLKSSIFLVLTFLYFFDAAIHATGLELRLAGLGVGSRSTTLLGCNGFGVVLESSSTTRTLSPGSFGKISGGVRETCVASFSSSYASTIGSSAMAGGGELGRASRLDSNDTSSTDTTLPWLLVRSISVPSFDVPLGLLLGLRVRT